MKSLLVALAERALRCRIYRHSLPRGTDFFMDMERHFGREYFRELFDVGANIGQTAVRYAREFPAARIFSFEPTSESYVRLEENVKGLERVIPCRCALGAVAGKAEISLEEDSRTNAIRGASTGKTEAIEVRTVDEVAHEKGVEHIDLLKIDTEGYEVDVLQGAGTLLASHRVGVVYAEAALVESPAHFHSVERLYTEVAPYGYLPFGVYEQTAQWVGGCDLQFCNVAFIKPELANAARR